MESKRQRSVGRATEHVRKIFQRRVVAPLPHKVRAVSARRRGMPRLTLLIFPDTASAKSVIYALAHLNGWRISRNVRARCDLALAYRDMADGQPDDRLVQLSQRVRVINLGCTDVSKRHIDTVAADVFGHDVRIDPLTFTGKAVKKSNANARHDGAIIECPIQIADSEAVYQRVVQNVTDDGMVEDIRMPVIGGAIPLAYRKYRPVENRFANLNARAEIVKPDDVASAAERSQVLEVCRRIGMEYGEVDLLRDRGDGLLYLVDANPTPWGPPNHLPKADMRRALDLLDRAFRAAFVDPAATADATPVAASGT
jgi:hypothetical protein